MSYSDKIGCYQGDCPVLLGRYSMFSDYIKEFSLTVSGKGLDLGTGPNGVAGKYFTHCILDGCDAEIAVVDSLAEEYNQRFYYILGSEEKLPYQDQELDFVICSCVIQHLPSEKELVKGLEEIKRVLKKDGKFYLMFKSGSHDTNLVHFNKYYNEERTFRVFEPSNIIKLFDCTVEESENLLDDNWIPYSKIVFSV